MLRKQVQCGMNLDTCEHCVFWEPIPFHPKGGVCMSRRTSHSALGKTVASVGRSKRAVHTLAHA
jgi:hypothetical protein